MKRLRGTTALLEVLGIYLVGPLVTGQLIRWLGVSPTNPLNSFTVGITDTELVAASRQLCSLLILQYAGYFLLIVPINWWHRHRGPTAYGLTKAGRSWSALLLAGLATAALSEWPILSVSLANSVYHFGETVPWRQAFLDTSWCRWEFWLLAAVLSWALIPVVEELFFRGYCQRRLAEDWGDGPAIIGTGCLFTFTHAQYQIPNLYNAGMLAGVFVLAIGLGVVFAWTRSLVPSMVAHAIINVPMTAPWQGVILMVFVVGAVVTNRRGVVVIKQVFSSVSAGYCVALAVVATGYAIIAQRVEGLVYAAAAMVVLAVALEVVDRRRDRVAQPHPP